MQDHRSDDPIYFEPVNMIGKIQSRCRLSSQPVPETEGEITRFRKKAWLSPIAQLSKRQRS
jgi:hypothetical protein